METGLPSKTDNLYERLGIDFDADSEQIKLAYRKSAIYWHPDKNKDPISHLEFIAISEAYEILSDPFKKFKYDSTLTSPERKGKIDFSDLFSSWNPDNDLDEKLKHYMEKFKDFDFGSFRYADSEKVMMDVVGLLSLFGMYRKQKKPDEPKQSDLLPDDDKPYK